MFLNKDEQELTEEYLEQGYVIRPVADLVALNWIKDKFINLSKKEFGAIIETDGNKWMNLIHDNIPANLLNDFRLKMIGSINSEPELREKYFRLARPYLEMLVGNELAMQLRVNLSIQLPQDNSSLLPIHADTWSGDSPFEVVVWIPLVDCYGTKSMYILLPEKNKELDKSFTLQSGSSSGDLYQSIANEVMFLEIKYGEVLLFNQSLPHGNIINKENETRWSMNCRFKSVFTPYGDKKLGEFFEPITLRAASKTGLVYQYPKMS